MSQVLFKRKTTNEIENLPIVDGQLIYNVENGNTYMDYEESRIQTNGGGNSNYSQLENKPQINGIELNGNKSLNDLGINNFSGNYDDLSNKPTIPTVPTNLSSFTDDLGSSPTHTHSQYLTSHQDISGKLDTSKVKNANSTTAGDVYDVRYINSMIGDIETLLGGI